MILHYDSYRIMVLIHPILTEEKFLDMAGAREGYAKQMFTDMFRNITSELIDVMYEYDKFYAFEYQTFEGYLYRKYNLDEGLIKELKKEIKKNPNCKLYRKEEHSYGKYEIASFTTSDTMVGRVSKMLLMK
jgi:hypothetical protein